MRYVVQQDIARRGSLLWVTSPWLPGRVRPGGATLIRYSGQQFAKFARRYCTPARVGIFITLMTILTDAPCSIAQKAPLNTLKDVGAALSACWTPPLPEQSRAGMQITVMMSFKRNGE